jgi:hypothetical protein
VETEVALRVIEESA